jgi:hypothetical protein
MTPDPNGDPCVRDSATRSSRVRRVAAGIAGPLGRLRAIADAVAKGAEPVLAVRRSLTDRLARCRHTPAVRRGSRILVVALLVAIVGYAAALRLDALTLRYGVVDGSAWMRALQLHVAAPLRALRPAGVTWELEPTYFHRDGPPSRYSSDPYTYLKFARQMRWFYGAHHREPLFVCATKVWLWLVNDQDAAVSLASALFSVLSVWMTYLVGARAFSRGAGLGAALAMAIECDLVTWGVRGFRDDAFTFFVMLFAYAVLRYWRSPSTGHAIFLGACGSVACLTRITALSFIAPVLAGLLLADGRRWKDRARAMALAVAVLAVLVGPYVINCWRTFGDPLYAINYHTGTYLALERRVVDTQPSAAAYVGTKALSRPFRTIDTVVLGLTNYPFANKWTGFDPWSPALGKWLSRAALLGLFLCVGTVQGRLLLLTLAGSLVPYAVTWKLIADWRFTEQAYPFFLIAACAAVGWCVTLLVPSRNAGAAPADGPGRHRVAFWAVALGGVAAVTGVTVWVLPVLVVEESLGAGEAVTIMAGDRDLAFFGEGWSSPVYGTLPERISRGPYSVVWVPLPRVEDYGMTVRLNPFPRPRGEGAGAASLPVMRVFLNGILIRRFALGWNPDRVGACDMVLPRSVVKQGFNRLVLQAEGDPGTGSHTLEPSAAGGGGAIFSLWYVRVRPPPVRTP